MNLKIYAREFLQSRRNHYERVRNNRAELFQKSFQKNINFNKNCNKQHGRLIEELHFLNFTGMIIHLLDLNILK